jgi:hypothetical protein
MDMLFSFGLGYVWSEGYGNEKLILLQMRQRLKDILIQNMLSFFKTSSKYRIYRYILSWFRFATLFDKTNSRPI